jgi:crossover junction endodeoxyribonuclease RuvC
MMHSMSARLPPPEAAAYGPRAENGTIIGIDPGLERTGYAILSAAGPHWDTRLHEAGLVRLARGTPLEQRLAHLEESLETLLRAYRPTLLACEELYAHYKHPRTAILMGHARGVVFAVAARCGLEVFPVSATHVKKVLTGSGRAGKLQVQRAVATTLGLRTIPEPADVADAIAIALCGLQLCRAAARGRGAANGDRA